MKDSNQGTILATLIATPVVIVCCGGGGLLLTSVLTSVGLWFTGANALKAALIGTLIGLGFLMFRNIQRPRTAQKQIESNGHE